MQQFPFLSILVAIPLIGGLFLTFVSDRMEGKNAKKVALWCTGATFLLSLLMAMQFHAGQGIEFKEHYALLPAYGISYFVGVDGLSLPFILLTTFLVPLSLCINWDESLKNARLYMALFMILESFLILSFAALNLLLFYIFFEAILIPMFFLIGLWGGEKRISATFKFFLYTAAASLLMLVGIMVLYTVHGSFNLPDLLNKGMDLSLQKWLWLSFFIAFAVKTPMWPFHTWLPAAHVQAPTGASMILAGVLLKLGGYGFLRYMLPLFPEASYFFAPLVMWMSGIGLVVASLMAFAQKDMKRLIAYASIAHMSIVTFGIFSFDLYGVMGATVQMMSHGLTSAAFFLGVGLLYKRTKNYDIDAYGGLFKSMPWWSLFFFLTCLSGIGFPATSGFVGELLVILGLFPKNPYWSAVVASGFILSASYVLWLCAQILFGADRFPGEKVAERLGIFEKLPWVLLVVGILFLGIYPEALIQFLERPLETLTIYMQKMGGLR